MWALVSFPVSFLGREKESNYVGNFRSFHKREDGWKWLSITNPSIRREATQRRSSVPIALASLDSEVCWIVTDTVAVERD